MTLPAAPTEYGGSKVMFLVADDGGGDLLAVLLRAMHRESLDGEEVGDLAVYPRPGKLGVFGYTLGSGSAEQIDATDRPCSGVTIWADPTNATPGYVGFDNTVTTNYGAATSGVPIKANTGVAIACRNVSELWIKGTSGDKFTIQYASDV